MKYRDLLETVKKNPVSCNVKPMVKRNCSHVHEYEASTLLSEKKGGPRHNHRFAGVTGEAIEIEGGHHIHKYHTNTNTFQTHHHFLSGCTGPEIKLPEGKHTHFAEGATTIDDKHCHKYEFATLIGQSPFVEIKARN